MEIVDGTSTMAIIRKPIGDGDASCLATCILRAVTSYARTRWLGALNHVNVNE